MSSRVVIPSARRFVILSEAKDLLLLWALLFAFAATTAFSATDVPYLSGRVVDNAEILNLKAETRTALTEKLKAHEQKTTDQIAVLTVPTIGDASIEEYATGVFDAWKLGQKGKDNGVLLVIAPKDRKLRIEVGYGLEGTLTDVASSRIIRNVITPAFKSGDFDKGVSDGVDAILGSLEGSPDVAKLADVGSSRESSNQGFPMNIMTRACRPGRCAYCSAASFSASSASSRSWAS